MSQRNEHGRSILVNALLLCTGFTLVASLGLNAQTQSGSPQTISQSRTAVTAPKPHKGLTAAEINAPVKGAPPPVTPKPAAKPVAERKLTPDQMEARNRLNQPSQPNQVEIVGEVVDSWCYASETMGPGLGEGHKACALACVHGGVTPAILDDKGVLYMAAKYKGYSGCKELLLPYVAKRVKVTGLLGMRGGCRVLKILTVEPAKDRPPPLK